MSAAVGTLASAVGAGQRAQSIEEIRAESYAAVIAQLTAKRRAQRTEARNA